MNIYHIRVKQTKYDEYPCFSFYNIEASNYHDADKEARKRFCNDFGFQYEDTEAYNFNRLQDCKLLNKQQ